MTAQPLAPRSPGGIDPFAAVVWGDVYEVAVKRGCLAYLATAGLLPNDPSLARWDTTLVESLHEHLYQQLDVVDRSERARHSSTLNHLLVAGYGVGWTALREGVRRIERNGRPRSRGLYCPLNLPNRRDTSGVFDPARAAHDFWTAMGLDGSPDEGWTEKGEAARADFFLWMIDDGQNHVFALEFSLQAPASAEDYSESLPNLRELLAHARRLESRGVFTRIGATLAGEGFAFSERLISHLPALTNRDKPLYKLSQAGSYATRFVYRMARRGTPVVPARLHAMAVTSSGVESIHADADDQDPRCRLMNELGAAYRRAEKLDYSPAALDQEIAAVCSQLVQALPEAFRDQVAVSLAESDPRAELGLTLSEQVRGVVNPGSLIACSELLAGLDETNDVCRRLGDEHPRAALTARLARPDGTTTLRDVHGETLRMAMSRAPRGEVTVIAAEGMPGVGKTTAVMHALRSFDDGYLWLYTSPRLVINGSVFRTMARSEGGAPSGVLTLATNGRLISGAREWWRREYPADDRFVDGAVIYDGVASLTQPPGSTLLVTPDQASEIEGRLARAGLKKRTLDERTDEMQASNPPGVFSTLATAAREVIRRNPHCTRMVLTPSVQGFRLLAQADPDASTRTTVDSLSGLFRSRSDTPEGADERRRFGARISTIVVMVDEIAGDDAGAPFVHALANWLHREFIAPFERQADNPFRVILVLADASLGNRAVMERYLQHALDAPEQVLVSRSRGAQPFRVEVDSLRLGGHNMAAMHVMADGFPARTVELDYQLHLTPVRVGAGVDLKSTSALLAIREQEGNSLLHRAVQTIFDALERLPYGQQAIFFVQNKKLLRAVKQGLVEPESVPDEAGPIETHGALLGPDDVAILDSDIRLTERNRLLEPRVRDGKRVFLVTSSGSRGVTIPLATSIIAMVPTFAVETGFMELAQLVYRGRGDTEDPRSGARVDGDVFHRRLVLVLQDFVVSDEAIDQRQWLRRTIDVLSALVLLRATLLTRMTGDAGVPGQQMAVVPVGRIGTEDAGASLSDILATFVRTATVYLYDAPTVDDFGLVKHALDGVNRFFGGFHRVAHLRKDQQTVIQEQVARHIVETVIARQRALFGRDQLPVLPDTLYGAGPVWLESLSGTAIEERFNIEIRTPSDLAALNDLRRQLGVLGDAWRRFPLTLSSSARDLTRILERPDSLQTQSFRAGQLTKNSMRWVCLPVDYPSFCYEEGEHGRQPRPLQPDEQALWHDALRRVVSAAADSDGVEPVIPRYEEHPFLVARTHGDPTDMERAFDDRYFMASTELNLLNTLLFVDPAT
jgi:hypothetical protein